MPRPRRTDAARARCPGSRRATYPAAGTLHVLVSLAALVDVRARAALPAARSWDDGRFIIDNPRRAAASRGGPRSIFTRRTSRRTTRCTCSATGSTCRGPARTRSALHAVSLALWVLALNLLLRAYARARARRRDGGARHARMSGCTAPGGGRELGDRAQGRACGAVRGAAPAVPPALHARLDAHAWLVARLYAQRRSPRPPRCRCPGAGARRRAVARGVLREALRRQLPASCSRLGLGAACSRSGREHEMIRDTAGGERLAAAAHARDARPPAGDGAVAERDRADVLDARCAPSRTALLVLLAALVFARWSRSAALRAARAVRAPRFASGYCR